jgi:hypothetical protein
MKFRDEHGVWIVDRRAPGVEGDSEGVWEVWLERRGQGHACVQGGSSLRRFYTLVEDTCETPLT